MTMHNQEPPRDKVATRQGTKQKMNMRVLTTSLVLIVLIFTALYVMFLAAPHSENEAQPPASGVTVPDNSTTPPSPGSPPPATP